MSVKHQIDVELTGDPANGCAVESTETEVDSVTVTGPVDVVREISRVVAYVDIDGANEDVNEIAVLHFLDSDGNELDQSKIRVDNDSVKITVKIVHQKTVNIEVQTSGTLADNLVLDSITVSPSTVVVMGDSELLNEMTSLVIPASVVNLSEITESMTTTVDLTTYLPEGVSLADSHDAQAEISVKVSGIETKSFRVPTANLTVQNLGTGLTAAFADEAVAINISGSEKDLASLTASQLTGYVDVSGLSTGSHTVTVYLDLEDDTYTVENQTVQIKIEQQ
jgi:YbbR domain-containing protein